MDKEGSLEHLLSHHEDYLAYLVDEIIQIYSNLDSEQASQAEVHEAQLGCDAIRLSR